MGGFLRKNITKMLLVFGLVCIFTCMLTFICAVPKQVMAAELSPTPTAAEDEDGSTGIWGNLGDLSFRFTPDGEETSGWAATLQILLVLTVITIAPSILLMVTSFTRILIVMHFVRSALGTQTTPPNQILIGLALFLTLFLMSPTISQINTEAIQPLSAGEITQEEAFERGIEPLRSFMLGEVRTDDLRLFLDLAGVEEVESAADVPTTALIPAFIISELKTAFIIGFFIFIPFLIIDMVVASTLMSMGMMMLPPTTISLPFKILLFIMADGWNLVVGTVVTSFFGGT